MGKPHPKPQLVTPATTIMERTTHNGVKVATVEETKERKKKFFEIIDKATTKFLQNLEEDKVDLTSTLDLERLVKMALVLSGEADSIVGGVGETSISAEAKLSMSKIDEILNMDDPSVQAMFQRIYTGYNELNDAACAEKEK